MRCRGVTALLTGYLEGDLSTRERAAVSAHLKRCRACTREAEALRQAERALSALARLERAPELTADLRRRLETRSTGWPRWLWGAAVATAVAAAAGLLVWSQGRPARPIAASHSPVVTAQPSPGVIVSPEETHAAQQAREKPTEIIARPRSTRVAARRRHTRLVRAVPPVMSEVETPGEAPRATEATPAEMGEPVQGVILLLGEPEPVLPSGSCYIEVTQPDGAKSSINQVIERDPAGRPRAIEIACDNTGPREAGYQE